jgi:hypothetical protein
MLHIMRMLIAALLLLVATVACQSRESVCNAACLQFNSLACGRACDCSQCFQAPAACDGYLSCVESFSGSCVELVVACTQDPACAPFITANCH